MTKTLLLNLIVCFSSTLIFAQTKIEFKQTKCNVMYYFYGKNQISFTKILDTTVVKIQAEGAKISFISDSSINVLIPVLMDEITIKVLEKTTNNVICQKSYLVDQLTPYKIFIDESIENSDVFYLNGVISIHSLDEGNECNLPRRDSDIIGFDISVPKKELVKDGKGNKITKEQFDQLINYKNKLKKRKKDSRMEFQLTVRLKDEVASGGIRTIVKSFFI